MLRQRVVVYLVTEHFPSSSNVRADGMGVGAIVKNGGGLSHSPDTKCLLKKFEQGSTLDLASVFSLLGIREHSSTWSRRTFQRQ